MAQVFKSCISEFHTPGVGEHNVPGVRGKRAVLLLPIRPHSAGPIAGL